MLGNCLSCGGSLDTVGLCGNPQCPTNKIVANYSQVDWQSFQPFAQAGWICPRCGKVNAPWKPSCDCTPKSISAPTITTYTGNGDFPTCPHCNRFLEFFVGDSKWHCACGYETEDHGEHPDRDEVSDV